MTAFPRLLRELDALRKSGETSGTTVDPVESNFLQWTITMRGPDGTAFENGKFEIALTFPETYPEKPPSITFLTKIFHPNVFHDGTICLDILSDRNWRPCCDLSLIIESLRDFLNDPNPQSPANIEAAHLYVNNFDAYKNRVQAIIQSANLINGESYNISETSSFDGTFLVTREQIARIRFRQNYNQLFTRFSKCLQGFSELKLDEHALQLRGTMVIPWPFQQLRFVINFSTDDYPSGPISVFFPDKPFHPNISAESFCFIDLESFTDGNNWQSKCRNRLAVLLVTMRSLLLNMPPAPRWS